MASVFFFKQKTAYEMRISDWSSDVCSSDLDAGLAVSAASATEMRLGHNVGSKDEVDAAMAQAAAAGARIVKTAHDTFWGGYAGYFQDPDGPLWEVVWNPQWTP